LKNLLHRENLKKSLHRLKKN